MPHFTDYLARCNYMLESGNPVSDVLMYLGDEQNHKPPQELDFPEGYAYDYCNPDVLLNRLSVKNGQMITPEGISYPILWLYDCERMLPETLEKILSFAKQGVTIVGTPPTGIATLSGGKTAETRFQQAVKTLWGDGEQNVRAVGKGKVYTCNIEQAILSEQIQPDINVSFSDVRWLHRKTKESDLYFLSVPEEKEYEGPVEFRCNGTVEIWDPLTGETKPVEAKTTENGHTLIEMILPAGTSCFVVFNDKSVPPPIEEPSERMNKLFDSKKKVFISHSLTLDRKWEITFPEGWGIESTPIKLDSLMAWKDIPALTAEGKAFSGTAVYQTSFWVQNIFSMDDLVELDFIPESARFVLNLGRVGMIAKVKLNGSEAATKWAHPYQLDVTRYIKNNLNTLEISVTSTWFNRLVYDAGLPEEERKTWTLHGPLEGAPLKDYGLLGPVTIRAVIDSAPRGQVPPFKTKGVWES